MGGQVCKMWKIACWILLLLHFRHLFALASTAYGRMMKNTENQVIVIR